MKAKRIRTVLCIAVMMLIIAGCSDVSAEKVSQKKDSQRENSLSPSAGEPFDLKLTNNGRAALAILLPDNPDTVTTKAAELLQQALEAGTGCKFSVVEDHNYVQGAVISLGETNLYKKSGLKPGIELGADGYSITEKAGNIFLIGGNRRGAISPVIALVEEDLGGRFYSRHDGLQMPKLLSNQTVSLREYAPHFKIRTMFQSESFNKDFQLFNRVSGLTERYGYVPDSWGGSYKFPKKWFVHTFCRLLPNDEYFDEHPEYFALIDGKRKPQGHGGGAEFCLTNPDVRKIVLKKVLDELKTLYPSYKLFDISANDTHDSFCQCPNCMAIQEREGAKSGVLLDFVNYIADKVAEVYPDVKITTLAYIETNIPPKKIQPRKNVIIRLCNDTASFPYPMFFLEESDVFFPNMKNWIRLGAKLLVWDYVVDFKAWPMPRPNLEVINHNIDTYAKYGVYGLFLQSTNYGPGENQGKLRAWVYSKKMWDPSRKMKDLIRDFNYGYFGKAADLMQSYNDLLYNEWKSFHDSHTFKDKFAFSKSFYPEARSIFDKALKLAKDDPELLSKVEFEFVSILFYRLQMMPPKDDADKAVYKADLDRFVELAKKYKVDWISERVTKTEDRVMEWRRQYGIKSDTPGKPITVKLSPGAVSRCADGAKKIEDIAAPGGECIKMPVQSSEWSLQWWGVGNSLLNDIEYLVRVQIKADKKKETGPAVACGLYSINKKKISFEVTLDASQISDGSYEWVDCGTVNGSDTLAAYFYFAQIPDSSIEYVYISAIEIVPLNANADVSKEKEMPVAKKAAAKATKSVEKAAEAVEKRLSEVDSSREKIVCEADVSFDTQRSAKLLAVGDGVAAASISPVSKAWDTKINLSYESILPGKYKVRALVKVTGVKDGKGIRLGIYSPVTGKQELDKIIPVAQLTTEDYTWIDLGDVVVPEDPKAYFFACSFGDKSFDTFLLRTVEFIPVK